MKLVSSVTVSVQSVPIVHNSIQFHMAGHSGVDPIDILEEEGDVIELDKEFDVLFDRVYFYGVRPIQCDYTPYSDQQSYRTWKCTVAGMQVVQPGTCIYSVRKTVALENIDAKLASVGMSRFVTTMSPLSTTNTAVVNISESCT